MFWATIERAYCMFCLQEFPSVLQELDLIEEGDQITHMMTLEDAVTGEEQLSECNIYYCCFTFVLCYVRSILILKCLLLL